MIFCAKPWQSVKVWAWSQSVFLRKKFAAADKSFRTYLDDFTACPAMVEKMMDGDTPRDPLGTPAEFLIVGTLMRYRGFSETEAWNLAWNRAVCHCSANAESEGVAKMLEPWEEEAIDLAKRGDELSKTDAIAGRAMIDAAQAIYSAHNNTAIATE